MVLRRGLSIQIQCYLSISNWKELRLGVVDWNLVSFDLSERKNWGGDGDNTYYQRYSSSFCGQNANLHSFDRCSRQSRRKLILAKFQARSLRSISRFSSFELHVFRNVNEEVPCLYLLPISVLNDYGRKTFEIEDSWIHFLFPAACAGYKIPCFSWEKKTIILKNPPFNSWRGDKPFDQNSDLLFPTARSFDLAGAWILFQDHWLKDVAKYQ